MLGTTGKRYCERDRRDFFSSPSRKHTHGRACVSSQREEKIERRPITWSQSERRLQSPAACQTRKWQLILPQSCCCCGTGWTGWTCSSSKSTPTPGASQHARKNNKREKERVSERPDAIARVHGVPLIPVVSHGVLAR